MYSGRRVCQHSEYLRPIEEPYERSRRLGYRNLARPRIHPEKGEVRHCGRLANDPHFADFSYEVIPQYWLLGLNGERLGRLDIRFKHRHSQRDYFAFESKRLHVTYPGGSFSTQYPSYTGDEGMMAFVEGYYSKGFLAGGMLAYVMDGKSDRAVSELEKRIEARRDPLRLVKSSRLAKSILSHATKNAMAGTHLTETEHDLGTHRLRILHLVLPVRSGFDGAQA